MRTKARSSSELHDVLHEGAVDLDDIDAELAQVAERGVAGAEIVDGNAAAEILDAGDEAARLVDILDGRALGDLDDEAFGDAGMRAQQRAQSRPPIGIGGRGRRNIEARLQA